MIEVTEIENFWSKEEWMEIKEKYFDPLIERAEIAQFDWEEIPNDYYFQVKRSYWDMRGRTLELEPGPKQLPPHIKGKVTVELETDDAAATLEIIQSYKEYWPGMTLHTYGLAQTKTEPVSACLIMMNYEDDEEEEEEKESLGDIQYGE